MNARRLRNKSRTSYCESFEPPLDNYVYCDKCSDFVFEYCSIHGPLLVVPDDKVPEDLELKTPVPRAALTVPKIFLHIAASYIPGAGLGIFSSVSLPIGVRFGPFHGDIKTDIQSNYCWQIYANNKPSHVIDAEDANRSNWMRYVNCARHYSEQNLVAYQYEGQIYYRTIKLIPRFTELLVFYGGEYANSLHIDLKLYNHPDGQRKLQCALSNYMDSEKTIQTHNALSEIDNSFIDITYETDAISIASTDVSNDEDDMTNDDDLTNADTHIHNSASQYNLQSEDDLENASSVTKEYNLTNTECLYENKVNVADDLENVQDLHKIENDENSIDLKITPNDFTHTNMIMMNGLYSCMRCNFTRPYKKLVSKHILSVHKNLCFQCDICNTTFVTKNNLNIHMETHITHPHKCDECNYSSMNKRYVRRHMKTHEKFYKCSQCDFKCMNKVNLMIHYRIHSNVELFHCKYCSYNSPSRKNLGSHIIRQHKFNLVSSKNIMPN